MTNDVKITNAFAAAIAATTNATRSERFRAADLIDSPVFWGDPSEPAIEIRKAFARFLETYGAF